jgi:hypothetical protein
VSAPTKFKSDELPEVERDRIAPFLKTLQELGGKAEPKELYPKLAAIFPQLTQEDLTARLPSSPSTFRWHNLVQWSRQKLVEKGEIDGLDARCLEADTERPSARLVLQWIRPRSCCSRIKRR